MTAAAMAALVALSVIPVTPGTLPGWVLALLAAVAGVGLSNPHLSVSVMGSTRDPHAGAQAAVAIPVVSQIGQAVTAAVGGTVINLALPALPQAASHLFLLLGIAALLGVGAVRASQHAGPATPQGGPH